MRGKWRGAKTASTYVALYRNIRQTLSCFFLSLIAVPSVFAEKAEHRKLAEFYAPVVYQETKSAVLDFVTRFDFDGDWNGANNWKNAYLFELPAYVYYAVVETTGHYFITYAFFHPRDYTARPLEGFAPKTEHENDLEGCALLIEKNKTPWGKPLLLETLAHDHFYKYDNPSYRRVQGPAHSLDGSIVFLKEENSSQREPAIYIEPEGHGVKAAGKEIIDPNFKHPGVVYRFAGRGAEVPQSNIAQDVSYDLIPIEDTFWAKRFEVGKTSLYCCADQLNSPSGQTLVFGSSFNGPVGSCSAKPPWGWDQADDGPIKKGDWFRDPLFAYNQQLRVEGLKGKYLHNPYFSDEADAKRKNTATLCTESRESKNLNEAITSTLFGIGSVLFSGGMDKERIGDQAKQLFLTDTVLLEWFRKADFEVWDWNKSLAQRLLPSLITENLVDQIRIPLLQNFAFSSPKFNAPARYFDSLVLKYKSSLEGAKARVFWTYQDMKEFDEIHSLNLDLKKMDRWTLDRIDLTQSQQWDSSKTVAQIKLEILSPNNEKLATLDPSQTNTKVTSSSDQVAINYIIFDRNSFADTFER